MRHLFIAAQLHSDERCADERGRHHPHPDHVGDLTRRDVEIVSLCKRASLRSMKEVAGHVKMAWLAYRSERSPHWVKVKNPEAPAEEDWGR
jgi:hypothetical protein